MKFAYGKLYEKLLIDRYTAQVQTLTYIFSSLLVNNRKEVSKGTIVILFSFQFYWYLVDFPHLV
jgi:hypothetical protein